MSCALCEIKAVDAQSRCGQGFFKYLEDVKVDLEWSLLVHPACIGALGSILDHFGLK